MQSTRLMIAALLATTATQTAAAQELPVFSVGPPEFDEAMAQALFGQAFGQELPPEESFDDVRTFQSGSLLLEFETTGGGYYLADLDRLDALEVSGVPSEDDALAIVDAFAQKTGILNTEGPLSYSLSGVSQTGYGEDLGSTIERVVTQRVVSYGASIETEAGALPVFGGGGEVTVALGSNGDVINVLAGFRPGMVATGSVVAAGENDAVQAFAQGADTEFENLEAKLGYFAEPGFEVQTEIKPVYAISGHVVIEGEKVPMRISFLDAETLEPLVPLEPAPDPDPRLDDGNGDGTKDDEGGTQFGLLDFLVAKAYAAGGGECGVHALGREAGLSLAVRNARGFRRGCRRDNWSVNFFWTGYNVWESDFIVSDDAWVDTVDFAFYTGHADQNGWQGYVPGSTASNWVHWTEVGGALDRWGFTDLEWMIIAACGPHQSVHFTSNTTNAFNRWRTAFDGLHNMLGYGAVSYDNRREGKRFWRHIRRGHSVHRAWFRAAREIQPSHNFLPAPNGSRIYATDMYAHNGNHCQLTGKVHGRGFSCPDVRGSGQRRHLWWYGT